MSNVLTREQFIDRFNDIMRNHGQDCANDSHPLWEAEKFDEHKRIYCNWFVCVKPIKFEYLVDKSDYWYWVTGTLTGEVTCFSSDDQEQEEWWGFTDEKDIPIWMLKWVK